eukprot:Unigene6071_Nuclearia_a/m.18616 Unigene6071_Nuclearia_a/g.18616  ORF Unigene6071_Nuclearia_a/g.18616 Unigene6071_Nuclearia_a/m.18616 type:complete len:504 (+) Unigene6071_Nuclearia_a:1-1512(+)
MDLKRAARWAGLVVGLLLEACSGTLYAWSSYSSALGAQLGYGKTELAVIVGIGDNGLYLSSVLAGFLNVGVGPRWTSLLGGVLLCFGYFMMAFTYSGQLANSSYILMGFYLCLAGVGSSCAYIAGLSTNVSNFGSSTRGLIVGLLVSLYGLSALIFTQFNAALFVEEVVVQPPPEAFPSVSPTATVTPSAGPVAVGDTFSYLLFLGYVPAAICLIGVVSLWVVGPEPDRAETLRPVHGIAGDDSGKETDTLLTRQRPRHVVETQVEINFSTRRLFKTRDFWLMFVAVMFGSGAGLMYINSVGYIVSALARPGQDVKSYTDLQVSLISAMSCTGRLGMGLLSDVLLKFFGMRRRILFSWCLAMMLVGQVLMLFVADLDALTFVTIVIGFAYGGIFSISPTLVSERFGVKNFGINWGWMCWATAIGGQIMTLLFGVFYDSKADEDEYCAFGASCYLPAFYINTAAVGCGLIVAVAFSMRRKSEELAIIQQQKQDSIQDGGAGAYH